MVNFLRGQMLSFSGIYFRTFLFLIYINDLTNDLSSSAKLFADDTSLFSVVFNVDTSAKELNDDLAKVQDRALRWKMSFNPDISKQAQEVIFSRKLKKKNSTSSLNV